MRLFARVRRVGRGTCERRLPPPCFASCLGCACLRGSAQANTGKCAGGLWLSEHVRGLDGRHAELLLGGGEFLTLHLRTLNARHIALGGAGRCQLAPVISLC